MAEEKAADNGAGKGPKKSLRDRVRMAQDRKWEDVPVPAWDDPDTGDKTVFRVFSMTGNERAAALERYVDQETGDVDLAAMYPELMIATCYDPATGDDTKPQYKVFGEEDAEWLGQKSSGELEKVVGVALRLSGLQRGQSAKAGKGS